MVKEPVYTYSSPNTVWINVVHKYKSGSVMTIKLRNARYSTGGLFYYEMLGHHWETSAQYPNDHGKKKKNVKRTKSLPEK